MRCYSLILLLLSLSLAKILPQESRADKCNYCTVGGSENTYCKYKENVFAQRCSKVDAHGITDQKEKDLIVKIHNDMRRKVAKGEEPKLKDKKAANMIELQWDDEL